MTARTSLAILFGLVAVVAFGLLWRSTSARAESERRRALEMELVAREARRALEERELERQAQDGPPAELRAPDAPASREPLARPPSVAERLAELSALVDELMKVADGGAEDSRPARDGLAREMRKIQGWLQREEMELRRQEQEAWRAPQDSWTTAKKWIDDASQLDDSTLRATAVEEIRSALASGDPALQLAALRALTSLGQVKFDKEPFRELILPIASSAEGETLVAALYALANTVRKPEDLELALRAVDDASPQARGSASHLLFVFSEGDLTGRAGAAALGLFEGDDRRSLRSALGGIWGARVSPELEARLLELARTDDHELRHEAIYFGLSTLQEKSPAVVQRLIEVLGEVDSENSGRALWGLGHGVPPASQPAVAEAMKKYFDARSDVYSQSSALRLIGQYGTAADAYWLQALRDNDAAPDAVRRSAAQALEQVLGR